MSKNHQNRGGGGGRRGRRAGTQNQSTSRGPRHADNPPTDACNKHWKFGKQALYCMKPLTCPWKHIIATPATNSSNGK